MESPTNPDVLETVYLMGKQVGKTECITNSVFYFIDQDPSPILIVYPTLDSAKSWVKQKFNPSLKETPKLRGKIKDPRSRDAENTTLEKKFPGGNLTICGANSPSALRQKSKRIVLQDEIDAFEPNAEGDPSELADGRAETFHNAVFIKSSTPTIKGLSRIEKKFAETDQRYFFIPCPCCGHLQSLKWGQVKWTFTREDGSTYSDPAKAVYVCESIECKAEWTDVQRLEAIATAEAKGGGWKATAPFKGRRGYHLNGIYRNIGKKRIYQTYLHEFVEGFLKAKKEGRLALMVWVNTFLAETFEEEADKVEASALMKRREDYGPKLPEQVLLLVAGLDFQGDRAEMEVIGVGEGEETWGVGYFIIPGKTSHAKFWKDIDAALARTWTTEDGRVLRITTAGLDSSAFTEDVYRYCKPRFSQRIYAMKGSNQAGQPLAPAQPTRGNSRRCPLWKIGTDTAKHALMSNLKVEDHGPRYMHFPRGDEYGYNETFFNMLTAEQLRTKISKGFARAEWHKTRPRNEALDIRVYALAALTILKPNFKALAAKAGKVQTSEVASEPRVYNLKPIEKTDAPTMQPEETKKAEQGPTRRPRRRFRIGGMRNIF